MNLPLSPFFLACLALSLAAGPASASESGHKAEGKVEAKADAKSESKGDAKAEAKPEASKGKAERKLEAKAAETKAEPGPEVKLPPSMGELREMIEHKISEVRANRSPAPVVRLQAKGGARQGPANADKAAKPQPRGPWAYEGPSGPAHWHELNPEFKLCGAGQRQSPIDIREGIPVELDPIQFDYKVSAFRVIDNGHTVQVNVEPGNRIVVNGRRYELMEFHFHRPSEERLNGRQFEMVAHLVHKDLEGKLAIVAVLIEEGKGHPIVQQVWNNLPLEKRTEQAGLQGIDLLQLLPEDRRYVTYMGSLSTPPCTEGVLWMVMKRPVSVSAQQISIFSRLYPMNARPVQALGDRLIKDGQ